MAAQIPPARPAEQQEENFDCSGSEILKEQLPSTDLQPLPQQLWEYYLIQGENWLAGYFL